MVRKITRATAGGITAAAGLLTIIVPVVALTLIVVGVYRNAALWFLAGFLFLAAVVAVVLAANIHAASPEERILGSFEFDVDEEEMEEAAESTIALLKQMDEMIADSSAERAERIERED